MWTGSAATFVTDTLIGISDSSFEGLDIVVSNCTLTVDGPHAFNSLEVLAGGKLTHSFSSGFSLVVSNQVYIAADGAVDVAGGGYGGGYGPGAGTNVPYWAAGSGGGYGGPGGSNRQGAPGGASYGSITAPELLGSGGGNGVYYQLDGGGAGGGMILLTVNGMLQVNGAVTADGGAASNPGGGGGSGGSIWINAGTLSGDGRISANGGTCDLLNAGGGGGGRIAICIGTNLYSGTCTARGGAGAVLGNAGTVYFKTTNSPSAVAQLTIDNGGLAPTSTNTFVSISDPADLTVSGGAVARLSPSPIHNLLIASNSWLTLAVDGPYTQLLAVSGDATIQSGGGLTMDGLNTLSLGGSLPSPVGNTGGGGGNGGAGGSSFFGALGGGSFGFPLGPSEPGSAGGAGGSSPFVGGAGGGALHLTVAGTLTLDGRLSADGLPALSSAGGGGAGGSLWINTGKLSGAGVVSANGGSGDLPYGGGGGGGQIGIYAATNEFTGSVVAHGGAGANHGGAGTLYIAPAQGQTYGQFIVDNGGVSGTNTLTGFTYFPSQTDWSITGGAILDAQMSSISLHNLLIGPDALFGEMPGQQSGYVDVHVSGDATVLVGGGISFDGAGEINYGAGSGGSSRYSSYGYTGGGGGYGGCGGPSISGGAGGNSYASAQYPLLSGSPGGGYNGISAYQSLAFGGGAVSLRVNGALRVDGRISANGNDAKVAGGGGGSGGGLRLQAGTIIGSGSISANGGAGDFDWGGGGGGGRIALFYGTNLFTGSISAFGGEGFVAGGAGTIYTKANTSNFALTLIDNGGLQGTNTPVGSETTNLVVTGGAVVNPATAALILSGLTVDSGGVLTHLNTQTNLDLMVMGNLLIGTNGAIIVDAKGYSADDGGPGAGQMTNDFSGSGAGYGGAGGAGVSGIPGGSTYGSAAQPTDRGSRGGLFPLLPGFCEGGGAIRLRVGGTLTVNGRVSANGDAALIEGDGGGAGGSIWITARQLAGTGSILANGGLAGLTRGGGGGGGRIALYIRTNRFAGLIAAQGGSGARPGGDGTIQIGNVPAPQVIGQIPSNVISYAVAAARLTFDSPLDITTVPGEEVLLDTPNGSLPPGSLEVVSRTLTTVVIKFPYQNTPGYYELNAGPQIQDIYGVPMVPYVGNFILAASTISGHVTDTNGLPVQYVTITPDGGSLPVVTDSAGGYELEVPPSWSGSLTPSKAAALFIPQARNYNSQIMDATNQNFILVPPAALTLTQQQQGNSLKVSWLGVNHVWYELFASTDLVNWQPYRSFGGANALITLSVPLSNAPVMFFRFSPIY